MGLVRRMPVDYVDEETGEIIFGHWMPNPERTFYKHQDNAFAKLLNSSVDKAMNVLAFLMNKMSARDNTVKASYTSIAKDMGFARSTAIIALTQLQENDSVRMVQYGLWMINPRLHAKGHEGAIMKLMVFYDDLPTLADRRKKKAKETDENA